MTSSVDIVMIKNAIQRGKPTYRRNNIVWIFELEKQKELNVKMIEEFKNKYHSELQSGDIKFDDPYKTNIGMHEGFALIINKYVMQVGSFRDGWHIKVSNNIWRDQISISDREKLFGDLNRISMWTQETDKVVDMMGELYKEIIKL